MTVIDINAIVNCKLDVFLSSNSEQKQDRTICENLASIS